jgi:hypothetical protein
MPSPLILGLASTISTLLYSGCFSAVSTLTLLFYKSVITLLLNFHPHSALAVAPRSFCALHLPKHILNTP